MTSRMAICCLPVLLAIVPRAAPAEPPSVAPAINALGLDLYRQEARSADDRSVLLSPYSVASALAMTCVGADGDTQAEMQRVLRLPGEPAAWSAAFHALDGQLADMVRVSAAKAAAIRKNGGEVTALQLEAVNRLFVQRGYALRADFVRDVQEYFTASPGTFDCQSDPAAARRRINDWVAAQTHDKIRDLLPVGQPDQRTRLALVNALYLRAAWQHDFAEEGTRSEAFHLPDGSSAPVPTMQAQRPYGYSKQPGYAVVTLPYSDGELQFVLIVPDRTDGLAAVERELTAIDLMGFARLKNQLVQLHLPKFTLAPGTLSLGEALQALGMKTAFDQPPGSANFDRMAPRRPDAYLALGAVYHKTWLSLDEHGTEAAATSALLLVTFGVMANPPAPIEVRADRPFLFAVQHVDSGVCLFLGRVTDPR